jgi:high-affinity Fe2+/Pb2+ permease
MSDLRGALLTLLLATVLGTICGVAAGALLYWVQTQ